MCEEVVGKNEIGQLGHLEEAAWDVGDLVVGGIKVCEAEGGGGGGGGKNGKRILQDGKKGKGE